MARALPALVLLGLLLAGCPAPSAPPPAVSVRLSQPSLATIGSGAVQRIDIECVDAELGEVMEHLGLAVSENVLVDPNVAEMVTVTLQSIPWREAVEVIAKMTRCVVEDRGEFLLLTQPAALQFQDADVRTVLQLVAAHRGHNIVLPDSLSGYVDLGVVVVDETAIQRILDKVGGYQVVFEEDGGARVEPTSVTVGDSNAFSRPIAAPGDESPTPR